MLRLLKTTLPAWLCLLVLTVSVKAADQPAKPKGQPPAATARPVHPNHHAHPHTHRHPPHQVSPRQGYWQPGGYTGRIGSPYYWSVPRPAYYTGTSHGYNQGEGCACGQSGAHHGHHHGSYYGGTEHWRGSRRTVTDPYSYHFGPGYYRHREHGHYRFPYYSYRRPWYYPGQPVFNRDTNFAW
jgi:hypothetical protein